MGTIDAFQRQVWSPQFKQNCFPHRSKMGVLKSFPDGYFTNFDPVFAETGVRKDVDKTDITQKNNPLDKGSSSKTSVTKPNETKMFRSALLYDVRKWYFFVRIIV